MLCFFATRVAPTFASLVTHRFRKSKKKDRFRGLFFDTSQLDQR